MEKKSYSYDVFLSHSSRDKGFVRRLEGLLCENGIRVFLDEKDIPWGGNIPASIERAIDESRHLILVLSPDSISSEWVDMERSIAIFRAPAGRTGTVLPLLRRDCRDLPGSIRILKYLPVRNDEEIDGALPQILDTLTIKSKDYITVRNMAKSEQLSCQTLAATFDASLIVVRAFNDSACCTLYTPEGLMVENTRAPIDPIINQLSHLQSEVAWIGHRFGDEAKSVYQRAGEQIRDAFCSPQMMDALEHANWIHFLVDHLFMDIPWELCATRSHPLVTLLPVSRSVFSDVHNAPETDMQEESENGMDSLRVLVIDTTAGDELGLSSNLSQKALSAVAPFISSYRICETPRLFEFQRALIEMKPNVLWFIGHQMEDNIPLSLWSSGIRDCVSPEQLAEAVSYDSVGLLILDCCKTGGSTMSDERAFPALFQKKSNWCVIHPFGWTAIAESLAFTYALFQALAEGASLPNAVLLARRAVINSGGSGWWSTLLQGRIESLFNFRLATDK